MHYKNGREAKVGDRILSVDSGGWPTLGIVANLYTCSDTCNLQVVPLRNQVCVTAKECVHVDDAFALPVPVTSPPAPIPGASPALEENLGPIDRPHDPCGQTIILSTDKAETLVAVPTCPDCGSAEGHTKGCARYQ